MLQRPTPPLPSKPPPQTWLAASRLATNSTWQAWLLEQIHGKYSRLERCFSSATDSTSDPSEFREQCYQYSRSLLIASTLADGGHRVFGGFAGTSWDPTVTCQKPGNAAADWGCEDTTSEATSFLFTLSPGPPRRFNHCRPCTVEGIGATSDTLSLYTSKVRSHWPSFMDDLSFGAHGTLGEHGRCNQGVHYECTGIHTRTRVNTTDPAPAGTCYNELCGGGDGTWQETELEVWGLVA